MSCSQLFEPVFEAWSLTIGWLVLFTTLTRRSSDCAAAGKTAVATAAHANTMATIDFMLFLPRSAAGAARSERAGR
jgi:hypothetical protein